MDYSWPGNVRELENAIEHAFVLPGRKTIEPADLPAEIRQADCHLFDTNGPSGGYSSSAQSQKLIKVHWVQLLVQCDWNRVEVGRRMGVSRTAVWKYMKKWGMPLKKAP